MRAKVLYRGEWRDTEVQVDGDVLVGTGKRDGRYTWIVSFKVDPGLWDRFREKWGSGTPAVYLGLSLVNDPVRLRELGRPGDLDVYRSIRVPLPALALLDWYVERLGVSRSTIIRAGVRLGVDR